MYKPRNCYTLFLSSLIIVGLLFTNSVYAKNNNSQLTDELIAANFASANAAISSDGRFVAFHSAATNLVAGDTNKHQDIFVYDRETKHMERISIGLDGKQADNYSHQPSISADGRFVAFMSLAGNLVSNDTNNQLDIFVRDRVKQTTSLVSVSTESTSGNTKSINPVISTNGRFIAFESYANNLIEDDSNASSDIFIRDLVLEKTEVVSLSTRGQQANHGSYQPAISADGRFVVFHSPARNLVPIDNKRSDENEWNFSDVFLRDRELGTTEIISTNIYGKPGNHPSNFASVSADGRYVAFNSRASDLVENYPDTPLEIIGKGRTAPRLDIYVRDRMENKTKLVSIALDGSPGNHQSQAPKISSDGRYVTFQSAASNLTESRMPGTTINIYRRDIQEDKTMLVTDFNGPMETNVMSAHSAVTQDGNYVVFDTNYGHRGAQLARESDVYVWNAKDGNMELISFANTELD